MAMARWLTSFSQAEKRGQLAAENNQCYFCRRRIRIAGSEYKRDKHGRTTGELNPKFATWDHLIPVLQGGTDDLSNRVLMCGICNKGKRANIIAGCVVKREAEGDKSLQERQAELRMASKPPKTPKNAIPKRGGLNR